MLLVAFFAAYLVDKRELLSQGRVRVGRWFIPSPRDLGPLLLAWGMALLVLAYEKDIGTRLLFFGVFAAMLYMTHAARRVPRRHVHPARGRRVRRVQGVRSRPRARRELDRPVARPARRPATNRSRAGTRSVRAASRAPGSGSATPAWSRTRRPTTCSSTIGEELGLVGTHGRRRRVHAARRQRVPHRGRRGRGRSRSCSRPASRRSSGCQTFLIIGGVTARDPAHRHHAAVRVVRRVVARRQLRAARDPAAHLRRQRAHRPHGRGTHEHRHPARRRRDDRAVRRRSSRSSPTSRSSRSDKLADDPRNTRGVPPQHIARPRPDRLGRRCDRSPRRSRPTTSSSTSACTRRRPRSCSRTSSATSRSSSARRASRTTYSDDARRPHVQAPGRRTSPISFAHASARRHRRAHAVETDPAGRGRRRSTGRRGSVVVLDVRTGGVVAAYSNPTFDPNLLVSHDAKKVAGRAQGLAGGARQPAAAAPWRELYPPGSTFKTVTASIALAEQRRRRQAVPVRRPRSRCPQTNAQVLQQLRRRALRRLARETASSCRATRPSARSASTSATRSRPASRTSACRPIRRRARAFGHRPRDRARASDRCQGTFQRNQPAFMQDAIGQHAGRGHAARRWRWSRRRSRPAA